MSKIRKGDEVVLVAGKDKGKRGTVLQVMSAEGSVLVEGVNVAKKHTKPNPMRGMAGGVVSKEMPLDISNVALFNKVTQKADRVAYKLLEDGRKVRVFKSNGEVVDA